MPKLSTQNMPSSTDASDKTTNTLSDSFNADERVDDVVAAIERQYAAADQARGKTQDPVDPPVTSAGLVNDTDDGTVEDETTPDPVPETVPSSQESDETVTEPQTLTYNLDGYDFTADEIRAAISTHLAFASLTPEQVERLNRALAGDELPPRSTADATPPATPTPASAQPEDEAEYLDPALAARMAKLEQDYQERMARLESQTQQVVTRDLNQQRSALLDDLNAASSDFATQRGLTSLQIEQLHTSLSEYGLVAAARRRYPNDPPRAIFERALDSAYRLEFFDQAVNQSAQQTLDQSGNELAQARERKARAAAVSGPTGNVPRAVPSTEQVRNLRGQALNNAIADIVRESTGS